MRPYISDKPLRKLNISAFSGGVNYRDGISHVLDSQLTDCRNVWFKNGILQTRPGMVCADNLKNFETDLLPYSDVATKKVYTKKENFRVINGITYQLVVFQYVDKLVFRYYSDVNNYIQVAEISDIPNAEFTCNIFQYNADIYCFCSGYYEREEIPFYIFKITEDAATFKAERITQDKMYIPTIMTNAIPNESFIDSEAEMVQRGAAFLEGYNLLGNRYKMVYSTAAEYESEADAISVTKDYMRYMLLHSVPVGGKVTATITDINGVETVHEIIKDENDITTETANRGDNIFLNVKGKRIYFTDREGNIAQISRADYVHNNMVVTAPCPNTKETYEKVLNMTRSEWFGGGSEGIYGGLHLFLGANTNKDEKALVCWSDFNKPLCFSENAYVYVGDKAQKVTAFGKQNDNLVIFKERELYATQYSSIDNPLSAEGTIVDVTTADVSFAMIQVHGFIGCDCPDSVQLCRNRLVWAHSDGKVYTLASASQWNERSIYEVSGMVEAKLEEEGGKIKNAISADWDGHYVLLIGDKFFLMDYNSYGYAHVYSYTKSDDAQMHIPWWIWEKPQYNQYTFYNAEKVEDRRCVAERKPISIGNIFVLGDELYAVCGFNSFLEVAGSRHIFELLKFSGNDDIMPEIVVSSDILGNEIKERTVSSNEVKAMAQTKLFDFGGSTVQKNIPKADISFGNNEGNPITVTTITDRGEYAEKIVLDFEETDKRSPQFFKSVVVRNAEKLNNRIGYRFESNGNIFIDSMTVYFKLLGGSK